MIKAYKLFTGTDGNSYFTRGYVKENDVNKVKSISFKESPPNASYDWHTAPATQYVICLSGTLEFQTSLGDKFIFKPGEILIATDVTGAGHRWSLIDDDPWKRVYVIFEEGTDIPFIEEISE